MSKMMGMIALLFSLVTATAHAKALVVEEYFIHDPTQKHFGILAMNKQLTLDHPSPNGYEVYGPKGTRAILEKLGVEFVNIKMSRKAAPDYPSFVQVEATMREIASRYPNIMRLSSIGKSVQGRDLYVMKVSDNVATDEVEPEVKYISSMHGNEITGRELMLRFLEEIGQRYNAGDEAIVKLVNNSEIYIMPSMNPDGSELRQRGNANYADLNRDFPDFSSDPVNTPGSREVETKAIMAFQATRNFALSANFHGGAEVVNYPWDTASERHPFDRMVQELSRGYARLAAYIGNSHEFQDGITNGYDWYEVDGGMQDWSYHWYNDLQLTIELSNDKWPNYANIPRFYEMNREALVYFLDYAQRGAGFVLRTPGKSGSVKIYAVDAAGATTADLGSYNYTHSEFYKVLEPGRYRFVVEAKDSDTGALSTSEFMTTVAPGFSGENGNYTRLDI